MKFDDVLLEIGEFGPYQKRIFYLISLPILISGAQVFSVLFIYDIPAFRCALPGYPNDTFEIQNEAHASLINNTIPAAGVGEAGGDYSQCTVFSQPLNNSRAGISWPTSKETNETRSRETCARRVFDKSDYQSTMVTEFDLVCGEEIMRSHSNMIAFSGSLAGCLGIGIVADLMGRKKALLITILLEIVYALVTYFAQSFYVMMAIRVVGGVATHSMFLISASTGIELVGPNKRSFAGVVVEWYWIIGVLLLLPVAYFCRDWRDLQLVVALACIPLLSLWWLIPESPRWLLDKEKYSELDVVLEKICKSNKCQTFTSSMYVNEDKEQPERKIWEMFTHRVLVFRSSLIFFNWFAVNLLYYGLTLNTTNLEGSPYLNYLFGALVEAAAYLVCLFIVHRVGRKKLHCIFMCVGSFACLGVIPNVLLGGEAWITNTLALVGKFSSSCCYAVLYILSTELFPTVLRNSGIGVCSVFESLGGMFSPYIADLGILIGGPLGKVIPMMVFGGLSLLAGGLSLLLPETLHRNLPETVEDAIQFGREESVRDNTRTRDIEYKMVSVTSNTEEK